MVHQETYFKPNNSKETPSAQTTRPPALMANGEVDAIIFELEEYDMMDDDTLMVDGNADIFPTPVPKLKSTTMGGTYQLGDDDPDKTKGRGFRK